MKTSITFHSVVLILLIYLSSKKNSIPSSLFFILFRTRYIVQISQEISFASLFFLYYVHIFSKKISIPLENLTMDETTNDISNVFTCITQQTTTDLYECKICNAPARYSYYGAIVCEPCKMFFRRNAQNKYVS